MARSTRPHWITPMLIAGLAGALAAVGVANANAVPRQEIVDQETSGSQMTMADQAGSTVSAPLLIPFRLERQRVVIPTSVNGSPPLDLLLDTGMPFDGVYLFKQTCVELMDTTGAMEVRVPGAGDGEPSRAIMMENAELAYGEVQIPNQRVVVSYSPHTQSFASDGVIGRSLFGHHTVEIDYDRSMILLHDTLGFVADTTWQQIPITIRNGLPFFSGRVEVTAGEEVPMVFYVDLASGEVVELLVHPEQKFTLPESLHAELLGTGLSGDIHGQRGRCAQITVGSFTLSDVPAAFAPASIRSKQEGADAVLGNGWMSRFNVVFDYHNQRLLLKPSRFYRTPIN